MRWLYPANIGTAIIDGWLTTVLVDSGARMNVVTPEFVKARGLEADTIILDIFQLKEQEGSILSPWVM